MIGTVQVAQGNSGANYVNVGTIIWPGNNIAGDFLGLFIATSNPSTSAVLSVADTHNTWTKGTSFAGNAGTVNISLDYWYVGSSASGVTPSIVITLAVGQFNTISAIAKEYNNTAAVPNDKNANILEGSFIQTHPTGNTPTTSQPNELLMAAYAYTNSGITLTETSGNFGTVVNQSNATQFTGLGFTDRIVSSTGAYAGTFSSGTNSLEGIAFIQTVKDIIPGGSNPFTLGLLGVGL